MAGHCSRRINKCPAIVAAAMATALFANTSSAASERQQNIQLSTQSLVLTKNIGAIARRSIRADQSGQLTAGDVDDNLNFDHFLSYQQRALSDSKSSQSQYSLPDIRLSDRVPILVLDSDRAPFSNAVVEIRDDSGGVIVEVPAGTNGRTTLFPSIDGDKLLSTERQTAPISSSSWKITARPPGGSCPEDCSEAMELNMLAAVNEGIPAEEWTGADAVQVSIPQKSSLPRQLDLALVLDTTGSMCDELSYLQTELRSVISNVVDKTQMPVNVQPLLPDDEPLVCPDDVKECLDGSYVGRWGDKEHGCSFKPCPEERRRAENQDQGEGWPSTFQGDETVGVRVGVVAYRDHGDDYLVQTVPLSDSDSAIASLVAESCGGGGDYPEAMDEALEAASDLQWADGNVARVAFLVADAPPHAEDYQRTLQAALKLRKKGVKVYGIAASGVADEAEYMMRLMSLVTGARYAWLTDDSGIGNPHAEPKVACYKVTRLDRLLVRLLRSELTGERIEAEEGEIIREVGSQEKGVCIVDFQEEDSTPPSKAPTDSPIHLDKGPGPDIIGEVPVSSPSAPEAELDEEFAEGADRADDGIAEEGFVTDGGAEDAVSSAAFTFPRNISVFFAAAVAYLAGAIL